MPYTRPTEWPDFGTGASPNVDGTGLPVSDGYDDSGAGAIPTAKNFNWWMQKVGFAIRWFDQQIQGMVASLVGNDSSVTGTTVKDALNTLNAADLIVASGSFNAVFPTAKTLVVSYLKYKSGLVCLTWPLLSGLDSSATFIASGTPIPSAILPSDEAYMAIGAYTGGLTGQVICRTTLAFEINYPAAVTIIRAGCVWYH